MTYEFGIASALRWLPRRRGRDRRNGARGRVG